MKNYILLLALLIAASCTKSETDNPHGSADGSISISSSVVGDETKALPFVPTSSVTGIQFLHQTSEGTPMGGVLDFTGVTAVAGDRAGADGAITFTGTAPKYAGSNHNSYLKAYYPAGSLAPGVVTWTVDGATDILVSDLWDAGTYTAPATTGLVFRHGLARVEVICQAKTEQGLAAAKETWGQITAIKLKAHAPSMTFTYATNVTVPSGTAVPFTLLNGSSYTTGAFTAIDIPAYNSAVVAAAAMVNPTGAAGLTLVVETAKYPNGVEVPVTFGGSQTFLSGKIHTVTLQFDPIDKQIKVLKSAITPWNTTGVGGGEMHPPTIIEYGTAPYDKQLKTSDGVVIGSTTESRNGWFGAGVTNGEYREGNGEDVWLVEKPYYKFEIAKQDLQWDNAGTLAGDMVWETAQGTAPGGLCAATLGAGWRLPRFSEVAVIMKNIEKLETSGNGFAPLNTFAYKYYWSATEYSTGDAFIIEASENGGYDYMTKTDRCYARCIRELPAPPPIGDKTAANAAIGDFSFSDGSFGSGTATLSAAQQAACIGIVYWTGDPTTNDLALKRDYPGCTHGMIVSLTEVKSPWQPAWATYTKTVNEWTIANATGFTQPILSDTGPADPMNKIMGYNNTEAIIKFNNTWANSGWRVEAAREVNNYRGKVYVPNESSPWFLPSMKELSLLCGLDNQNGNVYDDGFGTGNRDAMNAQLAKITGATQITADRYWSSTERDNANDWIVDFSYGSTDNEVKNGTWSVRFVRAF